MIELSPATKTTFASRYEFVYISLFSNGKFIHCADCGKQGSVKRLMLNTELCVCCTTTGRDLPAKKEDEQLYRVSQIMLSYGNNHEINQDVFAKDEIMVSSMRTELHLPLTSPIKKRR